MSTGLWTGHRRTNPPPRDLPRRHEQQSITTVSQSGLSLSLESVKQHIRIHHNNLDTHLLELIDSAVNWAELQVFRTCRPEAKYRMTDRMWPSNPNYTPNAEWFWWPTSTGRYPHGIMYFFMPPLVSVDLVRYLDGITRSTEFDASAVNDVTDVITLTSSPSWLASGLEMTYSAEGGTQPTGMIDGTTYFVSAVSANSLQLHTTLNDALLGQKPVDITAAGVGIQSLSTGQQVLPSTEYNVVLSTKTRSFLELNDDFDGPCLDDRPDAVIYDYTCGYGTRQAITPTLVQAMEFWVNYLYDTTKEDCRDAAERLLGMNDWGSYS